MSKSFSMFSWGAKGHKIVAEIAKKSLGKDIIDSVEKYLGSMSFEDASVWMDDIRSDHSYDYLKPFHYVNVEKDKTYVKDATKENCVEALIKSISTLNGRKDGSKDKINFALKELFHLIGDIHQPLHCGYAEDKGGNTVQVQFMDKGSNLHKVWDSEIIDYAKISLDDCLKFANTLTIAEKEQILNSDIEGIVKESRELLPVVYGFDKEINLEYINKSKVVIEKQLVRAGIRLAKILNDAYK